MSRNTLINRPRNLIAIIAAAAFALALPQQAQAQQDQSLDGDAATDTGPEAIPDEVMAKFRTMFPMEPLTAEQEARLPLARSIIDTMIPEGSFSEVMGSIFDRILKPISVAATQPDITDVAEPLGLDPAEFEIGPDRVFKALQILDPAREERVERTRAIMPAFMQELMAIMEPSMRTAMIETYAAEFNEEELADIAAFFSTDSGLAFARKSLTMSAEPRIISASFRTMPQVMAAAQGIEEKIAEAAADLPPVRGLDDLSDAERNRLAELLGLSVEELTRRTRQ